jgi:2'-5' RNA ligase
VPPRLRAFVALTFSDAEAERLDELRRLLGARSLGRVPPHVTLVPPIECTAAEAWALLGRMARAASAMVPFAIATEGFGYFVNRRVSGVLPVVEGGGELAALREALGVGHGSRPFVPHVTVGDGIAEEKKEKLKKAT